MNDAAFDELLAILDIEELEENLFRGVSPKEKRQRVFGGQVAGQALVAASRTVGDRMCHSLHAYFIRAGDTTIPIVYQVDRVRDGSSFTTRRVVAIQRGKVIFTLSASFQKDEEGMEHQIDMPENVPPPEDLPQWREQFREIYDDVSPEIQAWIDRPRPIDVRAVNKRQFLNPEPRPPRQCVWVRANGKLPDDRLIHQHALTYASDMTLLDSAMLPHAIPKGWWNPNIMMASLDHALWFHRAFRADEWLLYVQESPSASGARGFCLGRFYTRDGKLVASAAQEGLLRQLN